MTLRYHEKVGLILLITHAFMYNISNAVVPPPPLSMGYTFQHPVDAWDDGWYQTELYMYCYIFFSVRTHTLDMTNKGMIHVPNEKEWGSTTFHHIVQIKTYELFVSAIFHVIFLNHDWPCVTETVESKTVHKGDSYTYFRPAIRLSTWDKIIKKTQFIKRKLT